jgi:FAD synthase
MKVFSWHELVRDPGGLLGRFASAVGVFDGMHIGHQALIRAVKKRSELTSTVVTFIENPKRFLRPSQFHGDIMTLRQRLEALEASGVDVTILIDFSSDFSKLAGREFLSLLSGGNSLRFLAIGQNFRCGHGLDTGSNEIRAFCAENGIEMELISPIRVAGHPVSSSRIRTAIKEGRLEDAADLMGRLFELDLRDAEITADGRIIPKGTQIAPPGGIYTVELGRGGSRVTTRAVFHGGSWNAPGSLVDGAGFFRIVNLVSRE